ncbi:MAG: integrase/recombinase XerC [Bacteroidia bacterium]|jgi:integrase/recombinase XerC
MALGYIHNFILYLRNQKSCSPNTFLAYNTDLIQFQNFIEHLEPGISLTQVKTGHIRLWLVELAEKGDQATSINRKLSSVKSFFKYLILTEETNENPARALKKLKTPSRIPTFARKLEMEVMFDQLGCAEIYVDKLSECIIGMFYHCGIRLSELVALSVSNVSLSSNQIKVLGKGNKERIIPFSKEMSGLIETYSKERRNVVSDTPNFFIFEDGKPLYNKWVYRLVQAWLTKYSTVSKKSPHVLRHTYATHLLQNGAEINAIKELLGHAGLAATQIYAHTDIAHLKKIHKLHPKS